MRKSCITYFFKQNIAYEVRIIDCSSDVCSSDLSICSLPVARHTRAESSLRTKIEVERGSFGVDRVLPSTTCAILLPWPSVSVTVTGVAAAVAVRSEEHTSELQSLMRSSYAVFCLKKTKTISSQDV